MIFRAIFWVGLVALLMPHEPDLGFGRPNETASPLPQVAAWAQEKIGASASDPAALCRYNVQACAASATLLDDFRATAMRNLAAVKADIAQNGSVHLHRSGG